MVGRRQSSVLVSWHLNLPHPYFKKADNWRSNYDIIWITHLFTSLKQKKNNWRNLSLDPDLSKSPSTTRPISFSSAKNSNIFAFYIKRKTHTHKTSLQVNGNLSFAELASYSVQYHHLTFSLIFPKYSGVTDGIAGMGDYLGCQVKRRWRPKSFFLYFFPS